jgi:hypothetical protein
MTDGVKALAAIIAAALTVAGCSSDDEGNRGPASACAVSPDEPPQDLACTGLYADFGAKTLAPAARPYAPAVPFWSDGMDKDRYISLPEGAPVDATNVDEWVFPVGTKVWKEFRRGPRKVETRFFVKMAADHWLQASYVWSEDGSRALRGEGTDVMIDGEKYHVPSSTDCNQCHRGRKDKLLGFEAMSLAQSTATGLTLPVLVAENRIVPAPARTSATLPDPAFGVLHVNCGVTCHNGSPNAIAAATGLRFRLAFEDVATKPPTEWDPFTTAVGVAAKMPARIGWTRVKPGVPEESLVVDVMKRRGDGQMPPIATKIVDAQGVAVVEAWVRSLPPSP